MFGIEVDVAPDRSNVTLLVNGSIMAHNVTIECQNIIDAIIGEKESLFQLTLLFTGNFIIIILETDMIAFMRPSAVYVAI